MIHSEHIQYLTVFGTEFSDAERQTGGVDSGGSEKLISLAIKIITHRVPSASESRRARAIV